MTSAMPDSTVRLTGDIHRNKGEGVRPELPSSLAASCAAATL